ncbi:glycoprotein-N-acetylgalactosamine 3-beta-galactosyltransferase 1 [Hyalella azteca]|uniref:Glycoprotein-N-acetylgalactosamine 3-beta-galactosyltransferase 1 n=1 Tax=Hyalella azteca TaxID=294128 RepID=A0A979FU43_HYAAZ|nr:glycoprotein-N-acetylgalactosamine 3-beta-galactosyltransferase 1 [Hyalella azteca]
MAACSVRYMSTTKKVYLNRYGIQIFKGVDKAVPTTNAYHNRYSVARVNDTGPEDVQMENAGVHLVDSRDSLGRGRFFIWSVHHLVPKNLENTWAWQRSYYTPLMWVGLECCSDTAITFHYISPEKMRELDYLLYPLRPNGAAPQVLFPPALPPDLKNVPNELIQNSITSQPLSRPSVISSRSMFNVRL